MKKRLSKFERNCLWSDSNLKQVFEIFDQQESFKLDMIDLSCGVIRISIKCSCLEIFDQQGNPNLIPLVLIPYLIIWYQSFRLKIGYMFPLCLFFIFLVFNRSRIKNPIWALLKKNLRGKNESFFCVKECCEVRRISITYFLQQSYTNRFEDESS